MRAIVDSNVFVSYLLNGARSGPVADVLRMAAESTFRLVLPPEQLEEFRRVVTTKPFLRARIAPADLERFLGLLETLGDILPSMHGEPPRILRDRKDDYLIASARQNKVEIIVSGDRDLLEWRDASDQIHVVAPANLSAFLQATD